MEKEYLYLAQIEAAIERGQLEWANWKIGMIGPRGPAYLYRALRLDTEFREKLFALRDRISELEKLAVAVA